MSTIKGNDNINIENSNININISKFKHLEEEKIIELERYKKIVNEVFVETKAYKKSLIKLEQKNGILLTGNPGVGKTILSYKILMDKITEGYIPVFTVELFLKEEGKIILLLDDAIGAIEYDKNQVKDIEKKLSLFDIINKDKIVIINTRINLLETFDEDYEKFSVKRLEKYKIAIEKLEDVEKFQILKNHLLNYSSENLITLFEKEKYNDKITLIIKHKNFNPRQIDFFKGREEEYRSAKLNLADTIIESLNNPDQIYKNPFLKLSLIEQDILRILYLEIENMNFVDENNLIKELIEFVGYESLEIKKGIRNLKNSYIFLDETLGKIKFQNPSIKDFMANLIVEDNNFNKFSNCSKERYIKELNRCEYISDESKEKMIKENIRNIYDYTFLLEKAKGNLTIKGLLLKAMKENVDNISHYQYQDLVDSELWTKEEKLEFITIKGLKNINLIRSNGSNNLILIFENLNLFKKKEIMDKIEEDIDEIFTGKIYDELSYLSSYDDIDRDLLMDSVRGDIYDQLDGLEEYLKCIIIKEQAEINNDQGEWDLLSLDWLEEFSEKKQEEFSEKLNVIIQVIIHMLYCLVHSDDSCIDYYEFQDDLIDNDYHYEISSEKSELENLINEFKREIEEDKS